MRGVELVLEAGRRPVHLRPRAVRPRFHSGETYLENLICLVMM